MYYVFHMNILTVETFKMKKDNAKARAYHRSQVEIQKQIRELDNHTNAVPSELDTLRRSVADVINGVDNIRDSLKLVDPIIPMFDINFLKNDPVNNTSLLNTEYMVLVGSQFVVDYKNYRDKANEIALAAESVLKDYTALDAIIQSGNVPTPELLESIRVGCIVIFDSYSTWSVEFINIVGGVTGDLIAHINTIRPATHQIENPFLNKGVNA